MPRYVIAEITLRVVVHADTPPTNEEAENMLQACRATVMVTESAMTELSLTLEAIHPGAAIVVRGDL